MKPKIIFLVGPTAVGKTKVAAILARRLNGQILSCDSMQVYKKMDIITSKPGAYLRKRIKHRLINLLEPTKEYDVSRYRKDALKNISQTLKEEKLPIFVGGTGLYVSVLIDGIFKAKAQDKGLRRRLYRQGELKGPQHLYKKLQKIDPPAAAKIHPHDFRRIIRALEVFSLTGKPISWLQQKRRGLADEYDIGIFCLNMSRDKLYQRIDRRVERMFKQGLLSEVKKILRLNLSKTAYQAIGIRELKGYFDGQYGLREAKRQMQRNTRRYAKRQLTWFRKDKRINWIYINDKDKPGETTKRIISRWKELY